jgi:D-amino peptidase
VNESIKNWAGGMLAALTATAGVGIAQAKELAIYISADMEGVAGAVTQEQLGPSGFEYQRFRELMTAEVNAAIEGATAAGATRIVVSDSHGNGQSLLLEKFPDSVKVVRASPRPLQMMQGIEEGNFDGAILLGYHTATTNLQGVRAHTLSSAKLTAVRLNGQAVSEAGISAAVAGHFGVPVILVTGDSEVVKETQALLGDVEGAVVKWPYGFHSAQTLTPQAACNLIRERAAAAVHRIADFKPHKLKGPVTLDVSFKNYRPVELLGYLPIVERVDSHTIRYRAADMTQVSKFLVFALEYHSELAP